MSKVEAPPQHMETRAPEPEPSRRSQSSAYGSAHSPASGLNRARPGAASASASAAAVSPQLTADSQLFGLLLGQPVSAVDDSLAGTGSLGHLAATGDPYSELLDGVAARLSVPATADGLTATLLLPSGGQVHLEAQPQGTGLAIALRFSDRQLFRRVQTQRGGLERELAGRLGHAVSLVCSHDA